MESYHEHKIARIQHRIDTEFWIDRYGKKRKFVGDIEDAECSSLHSQIASTLYPESNDPKKILFRLGWIAYGSAVYGTRIDKTPSNSQCKTMIDLGHEFILLMDETYFNLNFSNIL